MGQHKLTLQDGTTLMVDEDKSLFEALRESGHYVKSSCGGHATCSDCIIKVLAGEDNLNAPSFDETKLIGNVFHITKERLSCQTRLEGEVTIDISAHNKDADALRILEKTKSLKTSNTVPNASPLEPRDPNLKVKRRSREEVDSIMEERDKLRSEKNEKRNSWEKFWEKEPDSKRPSSGGGKRPKPFRTDFENIKKKERPEKSSEKRSFDKKGDDRGFEKRSFDKKGDDRGFERKSFDKKGDEPGTEKRSFDKKGEGRSFEKKSFDKKPFAKKGEGKSYDKKPFRKGKVEGKNFNEGRKPKKDS